MTPIDITETLNEFERVYFWSDTHFNHSRVIEMCVRPFKNINDMNGRLVREWLSLDEDCLLIHLGDVTFGGNTYVNDIIAMTRCQNILIAGNHDYKSTNKVRNLDFDEIYTEAMFDEGVLQVLLTHVPVPTHDLGTFVNLHGHLHNKHYMNGAEKSRYHNCLSVEHTSYKPISLEAALAPFDWVWESLKT